MKRTLLISTALVAAIVIIVVLGIKRVPKARQAVLVRAGRAVAEMGPGTHWVFPGRGRLITYPVGSVELRCPPEGSYGALTSEGLPCRVALRVQLRFEDSASRIHAAVGEDYKAAIVSRFRSATEIIAATEKADALSREAVRLAGRMAEEVNAGLVERAVRVTGFNIEEMSLGTPGTTATINVTSEPLRKVVFVGVDGADWRIIDDLIGQGKLPNFRKLKEKGATGPLRSIEPILSPMIWTTMATGKLPEEHGILNFTVADPETGRKVPITRRYRKVDAIWNMLSDYDRTVDIVGWLATFPAEQINGVMVTDRVGYLAYAEAEDEERTIEGGIAPADRVREISSLVRRSSSVRFEEFSPFVQIDESRFLENRSRVFDPKNPTNNMIMLYASTESYRQIALHLLREGQPDFLAVYFELVDATKHLFMHYAPPRLEHVDPEAYRVFKDAVTQAYVYQDRIIGEIMDLCDDNTIVIVASDHGFKSGRRRPTQRPEIWAGKAAFWHELNGIICMYGPGIREGSTIRKASIVDIVPTCLALQGFPEANDMPGRVLDSVFDSELMVRLNREKVATLERVDREDDMASVVGDGATDEALRKLEALGYITPENPDAHNNLGQRLQEQGKHVEAIEEFKKALAINPSFPAALNNLGVCYGKLRRYDDARESFVKALALNPEDTYAMNNIAVLYIQTGSLDQALKWAKKSIEVEPGYANGRLTVGSIYANMGELDRAEVEFRKVLELDPSNKSAQLNLQKLKAAQDAR
ncbi:MAG: alkaline phosphatase family protein [bacterium]|nr:alkaline phosphatase family protein [bacterium]